MAYPNKSLRHKGFRLDRFHCNMKRVSWYMYKICPVFYFWSLQNLSRTYALKKNNKCLPSDRGGRGGGGGGGGGGGRGGGGVGAN